MLKYSVEVNIVWIGYGAGFWLLKFSGLGRPQPLKSWAFVVRAEEPKFRATNATFIFVRVEAQKQTKLPIFWSAINKNSEATKKAWHSIFRPKMGYFNLNTACNSKYFELDKQSYYFFWLPALITEWPKNFQGDLQIWRSEMRIFGWPTKSLIFGLPSPEIN